MTPNENDPPIAAPVLDHGAGPDDLSERKLYLGTRLLVLFYLIPAVVMTVLSFRTADAYLIGRASGQLFVLLIVWAAASIAWVIFRRSNLAYNLTTIFGVLFFMCSFASVKILETGRQIEVNRKVAAIQADASTLHRQAIEAIERGESPNRELAVNYTELLNGLAGEVSGQDAIAAQSSSEVLSRLISLTDARDEAHQRFNDAGGFETTNATTIESLESRILLIDELIMLQEPLRTFRLESEVADQLSQHGASESQIRALMQRMKLNASSVIQQRVSQADYDTFVAYREILAFLRDYRDEWYYDTDTNRFKIEGIVRAEEYNRHVRALDSIAQERNQLMRQALHIRE